MTGDLVEAPGVLRPLYRYWMRRWIDKYCTLFLAVTGASLQSFWGPGWEADSRNRVCNLGISLERFRQVGDRTAVRAELGLPADASLVLNVGRFIHSKRQSLLVDVAAQIAARRRDVYFVFIGAGSLRAEVERVVNASGLSDIVRFVPAQPGIERFWLAADAFAFPSVSEGFGIVIAEAAAAGLPIVAYDIPGVREAAAASSSAKLLPLDATIEDWTSAIFVALDRPPLSYVDRKKMLDRFPLSIEASSDALRGLYGMKPSSCKEAAT